jgi:hypothetical protein
LKKKEIKINKHPRSKDILETISMTSKIKFILIILIVVLFILSLVIGLSDNQLKTPTDEMVLLKLSQNKQASISSYKQYMIGDAFVNKMINSNDYVIIYPSLRITYDYKNDVIKSVFYIKEIING